MKDFSQYPFVNNVGNQLLEIKQKQIEDFYEMFKIEPEEHVDIYVVAEAGGRTKGAVEVGLADFPIFRNVRLSSSTSKDLPGRTIYEALPKMEKRSDKVKIIVASQSGEKEAIKTDYERIDRYIRKNGKSDKIGIGYITGNPDGHIGELVKKHGGSIIKVKGNSGMDEDDYQGGGFLGDLGELETCYITREMVDINCNGSDIGRFHNNIENHFVDLGKKIDSEKSSTFINGFGEELSKQTNGFVSAVGGGSLSVAETLRIRMDHQKEAYLEGTGVYVIGGNHHPKPPMNGNTMLAISLSGGGISYEGVRNISPLVSLCEMSQKRGAELFSIIGTENSPLTEKIPEDRTLILSDRTDKPCHFYSDTLTIGAVCAIKTMDKLIERGITDKYRASLFKDRHHIG